MDGFFQPFCGLTQRMRPAFANVKAAVTLFMPAAAAKFGLGPR